MDAAGEGGRPGTLEVLVMGNLLASLGHFTHYAVFLDRYPGPPWIPGPGFVIGAWCVGHYLYGPPSGFDVLTNLLTVLEGVAGLLLLLHFVPLVLRAARSAEA